MYTSPQCIPILGYHVHAGMGRSPVQVLASWWTKPTLGDSSTSPQFGFCRPVRLTASDCRDTMSA